jgi:adenylate cyclase
MAGVEFHAAAADTLLSDTFIASTPMYQMVLIIVVVALGAIALGRFVQPLVGVSGATAILAAVIGTWIGSFVYADYFFPMTGPLVAVLSGFALSLTDRVSVEKIEKQQARSMLSRYLPSGIVNEMLKNPVAAQLGGKRAELTVLFSDIRGFTTVSEQLAPEEVVNLLNQYLTVMTEVVFQYGGTVDKFEGDAILAFFGAPQAHDDDPQRAVRTAQGMRERLVELEVRWRERTQFPLRIGIAINTGQAMVGNIGSQRRMDYTVIGDAVNLAARLQDLTKEYDASILISGSTHARVKHMCRVRSLGSVEVRGRRQPVDLYEVVGLEEDAPIEKTGTPQETAIE